MLVNVCRIFDGGALRKFVGIDAKRFQAFVRDRDSIRVFSKDTYFSEIWTISKRKKYWKRVCVQISKFHGNLLARKVDHRMDD